MHKLLMVKKIIVVLLVLIIFLSASLPASAADETGLKLTDLSVSVWPEYDKPKDWPADKPVVLIRYEGTFVNNGNSDYSGPLSFNIPDGNISVNMVCETENGMACQPYNVAGNQISWNASRPIKPGEKFPFMVEYYYNPISGSDRKTFDFVFKPSYNIDSLVLDVKQPLKATEFKLIPQSNQTQQDSQGFNTFYYRFLNLTIQDIDKVKVKVSYKKPDNKPSVAAPTGNSNSGGSGEALGTGAWTQPTVLVMILFTVLLLGFFIYYGLTNSSKSKKNRVKVKTKQPKKKQTPSASMEKRRIRQLLIDGHISEETYRELIADLEN